jgi:8-amino-7-oxononanoate synthase
MGTLSKALGSYGGYLAASEPVVELLKSRARGLVYSTGLPPAAVGAALKALEILEAEPERAARPLELASRFAKAAGLPAAQSAIVPLVTGDADLALRFSALLREEGFLAAPIRPPTVPEGGSRLRFTFSAAHAEEDVDRLGEVTARLKARLL